jgi:signal transduction histidine kinase
VVFNGPAPTVAGGFSLETLPIRAPHDVVAVSRRIRVASEEFGLPPKDVRRLSVAVYETARLLAPSDDLEAEIRLADGPSLQVIFRVFVDRDDARADLRARIEPGLAALLPLVHALRIQDTPVALEVCLRVCFPTGAEQPGRAVVTRDIPVTATELDGSLDTLRKRFAAVEQAYRDLQFELQETNSGVVALYAELDDQVEKRKRLEEDLRRRAEELEEANRAKEDFLATLSHELRTPLNAMLGWTRLLRMGKLDAEAASRALETIERNARAQEQLIADILDVSRIVTGKLRLKVRPIDLVPVVEAALDSVQPAAEAKGIRLVSHLAACTMVLGDADRLQQVFWNLLVNAIKFTAPGGEVAVSIECHAEAAVVTVADSGEGIAEDLLPFIFDRFRQGDGSATRPHGGLGLGLSIVRHIVEMHGGRVKAASDGKGKGAAFSVELPYRPASF